MKNERIKEITRKAIEHLITALNQGRSEADSIGTVYET